ncbi:MAG: hypothetical protein DA405_04570 [Bacteroidetes bacterium]|nr:MAG: hypothetical protein DA405_04570 [Bacteroidota bacterium]
MDKVFYLSTCSTCKTIMKTWDLIGIEEQDLKKENINESELEFLRARVNSYEELLNKRARLLKDHDLSDGPQREEQIRQLILFHYSFLKRPILVLKNEIFVGNSTKITEAAKLALENR